MVMREMTPRQVGLIIGGGGLLAAWLAAAAGAPGPERAAQTPTLQTPPAVEDPLVAQIRQQTARLHAYLDHVPPRPEPARNPFRFAPERRETPSPPPSAPAPSPSAAPAAARRSVAAVRLIGIAASGSGDDSVRTAIFAGPSDTYLARVGDVIADQYRVAAIGAEAVELIRLDDDARLTLAFR